MMIKRNLQQGSSIWNKKKTLGIKSTEKMKILGEEKGLFGWFYCSIDQ